MRHWMLCLLCIISYAIRDCYSSDAVPKPLQGGDKKNPGAVLRMTKNGADYLFKTGGEVMNNVVQDLEIKKLDVKMPKQAKGHLTLTDIKVYKFQAPKEYVTELIPSDRMKFRIVDLRVIGIEANTDAKVLKYEFEGPLKADIENMDIDLITKMDVKKGKPKVGLIACEVRIKALKMHTEKITGSGAFLLKTFKSMIEERGKTMIKSQLCKRIRGFIENGLNKRFAKMSALVSLRSNNEKSLKAEQLLDVDLKKYKFDYNFLEKPTVTEKYIESLHRGEISLNGKGKTPFHPQKMDKMTQTSTERHFYIQLSDYTINSLLYHIYKKKGFKVTANPQTVPSAKEFLKTSCGGSGKCFGEVHPGVGKKFPGKDVEVEHSPIKAPYVVIKEKKMKLYQEGTLKASVMTGKETVLEGKTVCTATIDPGMKKDVIHGTVKYDECFLDVTKGEKVGGGKLDEFTRTILEKHTNEVFRAGIPLPRYLKTELENNKVSVNGDRALEIETDVKLNKEAILKKYKKRIMKILSNL